MHNVGQICTAQAGMARDSRGFSRKESKGVCSRRAALPILRCKLANLTLCQLTKGINSRSNSWRHTYNWHRTTTTIYIISCGFFFNSLFLLSRECQGLRWSIFRWYFTIVCCKIYFRPRSNDFCNDCDEERKTHSYCNRTKDRKAERQDR